MYLLFIFFPSTDQFLLILSSDICWFCNYPMLSYFKAFLIKNYIATCQIKKKKNDSRSFRLHLITISFLFCKFSKRMTFFFMRAFCVFKFGSMELHSTCSRSISLIQEDFHLDRNIFHIPWHFCFANPFFFALRIRLLGKLLRFYLFYFIFKK